MTWPQLLTILLTGVFAVSASALGQFVGGRMAQRRDDQDREHRERERFSEPKREIYLAALEQAASMKAVPTPERVRMVTSLSLFDRDVARQYGEATSAQARVFTQAEAAALEVAQRVAEEIAAEAAAGAFTDAEAAKREAIARGKKALGIESLPLGEWVDEMMKLGEAMRRSLGIPDVAGAQAPSSVQGVGTHWRSWGIALTAVILAVVAIVGVTQGMFRTWEGRDYVLLASGAGLVAIVAASLKYLGRGGRR